MDRLTDEHRSIDLASDADQEYKYLVGSKTFSSTCHILSDESRIPLHILNGCALGAIQTSGPNYIKQVLATRGPIFISGKYGSRGRYIELIKTGQNIGLQRLKPMS